MRGAILALVLSCCAPRLAIEAADDEARQLAAELLEEMQAAGSSALAFDRPGLTVIADSAELSRYNERTNGCASGVHFPAERLILVASDDWYTCIGENASSVVLLTKETRRMVLAHELGHAAGFAHSDAGLMKPTDHSCLKRAGACLAELLGW
jgi:hypothetical protein